MISPRRLPVFLALLCLLAAPLFAPTPALAHCDGLDGPVVGAARDALHRSDVNRVLIWVRPADEPVIRAAFRKALEVRRLGAAAQDMADTYFFETLVRVHRAGEGASYDGLKPAGRDLGPAIPAADEAVKGGDAGKLADLLAHAAMDGVRERFERVLALQKYSPADVEAGRKYVAAYVAFLHYVEGVYGASRGGDDHAHPGEGARTESSHSEGDEAAH